MDGLENIEQANNLTSNGLVEWRDFALGKLDDIEKLLDEEEMPVDIVQSVKEHASFGFKYSQFDFRKSLLESIPKSNFLQAQVYSCRNLEIGEANREELYFLVLKSSWHVDYE